MSKSLPALIIFFLISSLGSSQIKNDLTFESSIGEAFEKYSVLRSNDPNEYVLGIVYFDATAGMSFRYLGNLNAQDDDTLQFEGIPNGMMIMRIESNWNKSHILSDDDVAVLKLEEDFVTSLSGLLKNYNPEKKDLKYKYDLGFAFNHSGDGNAALPYLMEVHAEDPLYERLPFEIAFAYNASGQYDKALKFIDSSDVIVTEDILLLKELNFAYANSDQIDKSIKLYDELKSKDFEKELKAEIAFNIAGHYFRSLNRDEFLKWKKETNTYNNTQLDGILDQLEAQLKIEIEKSTTGEN
ncbi:tetratricopeptide repeat protein [Nonlabens ponticola]|uniref:Tetratricopeptide repeat protein n=1 Tax=Nonlabens ponticola TaxID=2496866 RepID=A0A3S9MWW8_9FLAO|nr:tetratricopeptide repeat protein [Nonlabens ponticola]AZQ43634.1 tetratricopeptide repeat protein [Nonlabens ponticola]